MAVYVVSFAPQHEIVVSESDAELVADECRAAGLAFLEGAASWDKRELGEWLLGPYRDATRHARRGERCAMIDDATNVTRSSVGDVVRSARETVVAALAEAARGGMDEFAVCSVQRKQVVAARSSLGAIWVPVDVRARLADRVCSLFAVDALLRPEDYERELFVCGECESVSFDAYARARVACPAHAPHSGVVELSPEVRETGVLAHVGGSRRR